MIARRLMLPVVAALSLIMSACSVILPQQTFIVTTPEPGAEVYMSLTGHRSVGVNSTDVMGSIPAGRDTTSMNFIGTTPLTHTFHVTRHRPGVAAPGEFSTSMNTVYTEAFVEVIYPDGRRESRNVRLNNGEMRLDFTGSGAR